MTEYVMRETLASKQQGKPIWFRCWTAIGPCCTDKLEEAARFPTERAALQSPCFTHALSFFEPEALEAGNGDV